MNVFFYSSATNKLDVRIQGVVEIASPIANTEVFRRIEDLSSRLRRIVGDSTIAVLVAGNKKDLVDFALIRHLLSDTPIILILPDREESTISMGYGLVPRFLTYMDGNFMEVRAVLEKMLENYEKKEAIFR